MKINIIGMGLMGCQITSLLYLLGFDIAVFSRNEINQKKLDRSIKLLSKLLAINPNSYGNLKFCKNFEDLYDACTIESVVEDLKIKKNIYSEVRKITKKPFGTNSSSFNPKEIEDDVVGVHFFNPIQLKLVEVTNTGNNQFPEIFFNNLKIAGYNIVEVKGNRGYIGNYLLFHELGAALKLVDNYNYNIQDIKNVISVISPNRDIFLILDLIGLDVALSIFKNLHEEDSSIYIPKCIEDALKLGVLGKKNKTSIIDFIENR